MCKIMPGETVCDPMCGGGTIPIEVSFVLFLITVINVLCSSDNNCLLTVCSSEIVREQCCGKCCWLIGNMFSECESWRELRLRCDVGLEEVEHLRKLSL